MLQMFDYLFYIMKKLSKKLADGGNQIFMITAKDLQNFAVSIAADMSVAETIKKLIANSISKEFLSTKEVCTILRISRPTLWWSWRHDSVGKIMAMTINGDTGASETALMKSSLRRNYGR